MTNKIKGNGVSIPGKPLFERILNEMTTVAGSLQETQSAQKTRGKPTIIKNEKVVGSPAERNLRIAHGLELF